MRRLLVFLLGAVVSTVGVPVSHAAMVEHYAVTVDSETALGWLGYPATGTPTTLLVIGYGCCGKPDQSGTVNAYADAYGVVAVAMDYRGPGRWDVDEGPSRPDRRDRGPARALPVDHPHEFDQEALTAKAGNVAIYFENDDPFAHNVRIEGVGTSKDANGRQAIRHVFESLSPGTYTYICAIHPDMSGTLTVT